MGQYIISDEYMWVEYFHQLVLEPMAIALVHGYSMNCMWSTLFAKSIGWLLIRDIEEYELVSWEI